MGVLCNHISEQPPRAGKAIGGALPTEIEAIPMEKLSFTFSELITVGSLIVSVTTSYMLLKSDVKIVTNDVIGVRESMKENADGIREDRLKIELLQAEQFRMNAILNFLYGEGVRSGWTPSRAYSNQLLKEMAEKPWLTK